MSITIFEHAGFAGESKEFDGDAADLAVSIIGRKYMHKMYKMSPFP